MKKHLNGMTLVDHYYINDEEVEEYIAARNRVIQNVIEIASKYYQDVIINFQGSQDGEAITGYDEKGNFKYITSLDPNEIWEMDEAIKEGTLEKYLIERDGIVLPKDEEKSTDPKSADLPE